MRLVCKKLCSVFICTCYIILSFFCYQPRLCADVTSADERRLLGHESVPYQQSAKDIQSEQMSTFPQTKGVQSQDVVDTGKKDTSVASPPSIQKTMSDRKVGPDSAPIFPHEVTDLGITEVEEAGSFDIGSFLAWPFRMIAEGIKWLFTQLGLYTPKPSLLDNTITSPEQLRKKVPLHINDAIPLFVQVLEDPKQSIEVKKEAVKIINSRIQEITTMASLLCKADLLGTLCRLVDNAQGQNEVLALAIVPLLGYFSYARSIKTLVSVVCTSANKTMVSDALTSLDMLSSGQQRHIEEDQAKALVAYYRSCNEAEYKEKIKALFTRWHISYTEEVATQKEEKKILSPEPIAFVPSPMPKETVSVSNPSEEKIISSQTQKVPQSPEGVVQPSRDPVTVQSTYVHKGSALKEESPPVKVSSPQPSLTPLEILKSETQTIEARLQAITMLMKQGHSFEQIWPCAESLMSSTGFSAQRKAVAAIWEQMIVHYGAMAEDISKPARMQMRPALVKYIREYAEKDPGLCVELFRCFGLLRIRDDEAVKFLFNFLDEGYRFCSYDQRVVRDRYAVAVLKVLETMKDVANAKYHKKVFGRHRPNTIKENLYIVLNTLEGEAYLTAVALLVTIDGFTKSLLDNVVSKYFFSSSSEQKTRVGIIEFWGKIPKENRHMLTERVFSHLQEAVSSPDPSLRKAAIVTLGQLDPLSLENQEMLVKQLAQEKDASIQYAILQSLAQAGSLTPERSQYIIRTYLLPLLDVADESLKKKAVLLMKEKVYCYAAALSFIAELRAKEQQPAYASIQRELQEVIALLADVSLLQSRQEEQKIFLARYAPHPLVANLVKDLFFKNNPHFAKEASDRLVLYCGLTQAKANPFCGAQWKGVYQRQLAREWDDWAASWEVKRDAWSVARESRRDILSALFSYFILLLKEQDSEKIPEEWKAMLLTLLCDELPNKSVPLVHDETKGLVERPLSLAAYLRQAGCERECVEVVDALARSNPSLFASFSQKIQQELQKANAQVQQISVQYKPELITRVVLSNYLKWPQEYKWDELVYAGMLLPYVDPQQPSSIQKDFLEMLTVTGEKHPDEKVKSFAKRLRHFCNNQ